MKRFFLKLLKNSDNRNSIFPILLPTFIQYLLIYYNENTLIYHSRCPHHIINTLIHYLICRQVFQIKVYIFSNCIYIFSCYFLTIITYHKVWFITYFHSLTCIWFAESDIESVFVFHTKIIKCTFLKIGIIFCIVKH